MCYNCIRTPVTTLLPQKKAFAKRKQAHDDNLFITLPPALVELTETVFLKDSTAKIPKNAQPLKAAFYYLSSVKRVIGLSNGKTSGWYTTEVC